MGAEVAEKDDHEAQTTAHLGFVDFTKGFEGRILFDGIKIDLTVDLDGVIDSIEHLGLSEILNGVEDGRGVITELMNILDGEFADDVIDRPGEFATFLEVAFFIQGIERSEAILHEGTGQRGSILDEIAGAFELNEKIVEGVGVAQESFDEVGEVAGAHEGGNIFELVDGGGEQVLADPGEVFLEFLNFAPKAAYLVDFGEHQVEFRVERFEACVEGGGGGGGHGERGLGL